MIKVKLADVVVQVHIRDEYSWQRVLYCPWVNCKYYNDAKCAYRDNYKGVNDERTDIRQISTFIEIF